MTMRLKPMQLATMIYTMIAIAFLGWVVGQFGWSPTWFVAVIVFSPAFFSVQLAAMDRPLRRRELGYLSIVTVFAIGGTVFLVSSWLDAGMDQVAAFNREYRAFRRHVLATPEYGKVEVSCIRRKSCRVYLRGTVGNKESHDALIQSIKTMIQSDIVSYDDCVEYPGKQNLD